jgi:hypothetical protein
VLESTDTRQRIGHTKADNGKSGRGLKEEKFVSAATKLNLKKNEHEARVRGMRRETMPHGTRELDGGDSENKANGERHEDGRICINTRHVQ